MRPILAAVMLLSTLVTGCAGTYHRSPLVMVPLEQSPQLDSLIAGFQGDSVDHVFTVTDPRVIFAPCAGLDSGNFYLWVCCVDTYILDLNAPCTVSVALTDSTGNIQARRYYFAEEPGTYARGIGSEDWGMDDMRRFRFNVLIDDVLVLSCPTDVDVWPIRLRDSEEPP